MPAAAAPRRYARALFSLASEENRVAAVRDELRRLGAALEASADLCDVLLQPLYPAAQRRQVLDALVEKLAASSLVKRGQPNAKPASMPAIWASFACEVIQAKRGSWVRPKLSA